MVGTMVNMLVGMLGETLVSKLFGTLVGMLAGMLDGTLVTLIRG